MEFNNRPRNCWYRGSLKCDLCNCRVDKGCVKSHLAGRRHAIKVGEAEKRSVDLDDVLEANRGNWQQAVEDIGEQAVERLARSMEERNNESKQPSESLVNAPTGPRAQNVSQQSKQIPQQSSKYHWQAVRLDFASLRDHNRHIIDAARRDQRRDFDKWRTEVVNVEDM